MNRLKQNQFIARCGNTSRENSPESMLKFSMIPIFNLTTHRVNTDAVIAALVELSGMRELWQPVMLR